MNKKYGGNNREYDSSPSYSQLSQQQNNQMTKKSRKFTFEGGEEAGSSGTTRNSRRGIITIIVIIVIILLILLILVAVNPGKGTITSTIPPTYTYSETDWQLQDPLTNKSVPACIANMLARTPVPGGSGTGTSTGTSTGTVTISTATGTSNNSVPTSAAAFLPCDSGNYRQQMIYDTTTNHIRNKNTAQCLNAVDPNGVVVNFAPCDGLTSSPNQSWFLINGKLQLGNGASGRFINGTAATHASTEPVVLSITGADFLQNGIDVTY